MGKYKDPDYLKKYRESNKEKIKEYKENHKENTRDYDKKYRENNKEIVAKRKKDAYDKNKEHYKLKASEYKKQRMLNDKVYYLYICISSLIRKSINCSGYSKKSRTHEILGCSYEEFKNYLESKFEPWMNWENHGKYNGDLSYGWDIDHIIPISSAKTEEDIIKLNHYTNLQPLCSKINRDIKINRLDY